MHTHTDQHLSLNTKKEKKKNFIPETNTIKMIEKATVQIIQFLIPRDALPLQPS